MSETLKAVLSYWTDKEEFAGEFGILDLPFDLECFCDENDRYAAGLKREIAALELELIYRPIDG